ncbi:hypothetical protein GOP47_0014928 [Adiantum capillus-veneris]|uniref:Fungal lipase-type domain-containing protein n=1 Tax=Adiantum capillus-veneris TaxID=13818 RepID=A0A9D4ZEQ0_ADICA|nr:hypothetical protein GOP47_0014928 [Adiantum capillus-veneris]
MAYLDPIVKDDKQPMRLLDAIILSAAVYAKNPKQELLKISKDHDLPVSAQYEFLPDDELDNAGLSSCKQTLVVVRSVARGHYIVACRGTHDVGDALVDLKIVQRTLSLGDGAAHAGFLDRAKTVPLHYLKRLLIRNEKIVLTGHSLGGAVASLLTLRLLESTGKWCHDQIQCYTFGCPFFADYRLANYINSHYKQHFVHLVSGSDFVPKAMPVLYTLYSLWAGLHVGPLEDLLNCSRLLMLGLKVMKMNLKFTQKIYLLGIASEALRWLPSFSRFALHRVLALALSFRSGYGYAFAGCMMLLDPATSMFEMENREHWTLNTHLSFHFGGVSLDAVKKHRLLSYIEHVFAVQGAEVSTRALMEQQLSANATFTFSNMMTHTATFDLQEDVGEEFSPYVNEIFISENKIYHDCQDGKTIVRTTETEKLKGLRAFRSQVACVIFTKRLQEAVPKSSRMRKKTRGFMGCVKSFTRSISSISHAEAHLQNLTCKLQYQDTGYTGFRA